MIYISHEIYAFLVLLNIYNINEYKTFDIEGVNIDFDTYST